MKKYHLLIFFALCSISCRKEASPDNLNQIICWGDSLTAGSGSVSVTYPKQLSVLTGFDVLNKGVSGQTSTQIKVRMLGAKNLHKYPTIIWAGRNNFTDSTTVVHDIALMVNSLGHTHYLVLGILNGDTPDELKGRPHYKQIQNLNKVLAATYGNRFYDVKPYLLAKRDSSSQKDLLNVQQDVVPSTLRSDFLHLNDKGYGYVAEAVYSKFSILTQ